MSADNCCLAGTDTPRCCHFGVPVSLCEINRGSLGSFKLLFPKQRDCGLTESWGVPIVRSYGLKLSFFKNFQPTTILIAFKIEYLLRCVRGREGFHQTLIGKSAFDRRIYCFDSQTEESITIKPSQLIWGAWGLIINFCLGNVTK